MTLHLHLGVIEQFYTTPTPKAAAKIRKAARRNKNGSKAKQKPLKAKRTAKPQAPVTTTQVARWLEDKYGIMGIFLNDRRQMIDKLILDNIKAAARHFILRGFLPADMFAGATSKIQTEFKHFLSNQEMDAMGIKGVPTKASLLGKSSRFKSGYTTKPVLTMNANGRLVRKRIAQSRPSFIDSGLYQASVKAWMENK